VQTRWDSAIRPALTPPAYCTRDYRKPQLASSDTIPNGDFHLSPLFLVGKVGVTETGSPKLLESSCGQRNSLRVVPQPANLDTLDEGCT
jgi:hypothetical protein